MSTQSGYPKHCLHCGSSEHFMAHCPAYRRLVAGHLYSLAVERGRHLVRRTGGPAITESELRLLDGNR